MACARWLRSSPSNFRTRRANTPQADFTARRRFGFDPGKFSPWRIPANSPQTRYAARGGALDLRFKRVQSLRDPAG
jgi:hypothetical protein